MSKYKIYPLHLGTIHRVQPNMSLSAEPVKADFPILAFYLEGREHKILVDTGGSAPDGVKFMPYNKGTTQEITESLKALGVDSNEIDTVILTHLHWDHAGSNHCFPNAKFYVQKSEYENLNRFADMPGYERDLALSTKYELIDGDAELFEGVSVILTPGHTIGGQCILLDTEAGDYLILGDLVPLFFNWENNIYGGVNSDPEVTKASMKKLKLFNAQVLPGHDFKVLNHKFYPPEEYI